MSASGYCTDCENWTETRNGRCSCGSGRVLTPPAGYRILGPDEVDPVTVERCAELAEQKKRVMVFSKGALDRDETGHAEVLRWSEDGPAIASAIRAIASGGKQ